MREELLSWLLPEASSSELAALRRVITALRLLRDDTRRHDARAAPPWPVAHGELQRLSRLRRRRVLEGLLQAYLSVHRSADSFLELGPAAPDLAAAWRELLEGPSRIAPPAPDEAPPQVVARLIAAGSMAGAPAVWGEYWRASATHVFSSLAEAERTWRRSFARVLEQGARAPLLARFLAGQVAAQLDRFRPAAAWALYARHAPLAGSDAALRRLSGWAALFVGEEARARELLRGPHAASLPRPVAEFRGAHPEWAAFLGGEQRSGGASAPPQTRPGRQTFGARLLGVAVVRAGEARLIALDCERSQRSIVLRRARDLRPPLPGSARVQQCWRRREGGPTLECLGGANTAAVALALVYDDHGEVCGWLQLESAHGLLPSRTRLTQAALAWRAEVQAAVRTSPSTVAAVARRAPAGADDSEPRRAFAAAFLATLGLPPGVRAAWLEPDARGRLELLTESARTHGRRTLRAGPGGAQRAAFVAEITRLVEADPQASVWNGTAGPVLSLRSAERLLALLALESPRGAPLDDDSRERARARLAAAEPAWWASAFRAWHRQRFGSDLALALDSGWLQRAEGVARAALAARAPVLLYGPEGSGRRTLTRWLAFRAGPFRPGQGPRTGRTFVLEPLGPARQAVLAHLGTDEHPWLVAGAPASELCARGELAPELARALHPQAIEVPPLCARRAEIPPLVRTLTANVARRDGRAPPTWDDEALAVLFRQAWPGQVAELRALVEGLVLRGPEVLGPAHVRSALAAHALACCERLPLARGRDLQAALALTRHRNGNRNGTRAARYLGWSRAALEAALDRAEREAEPDHGP